MGAVLLAVLFVGEMALWFGPALYARAAPNQVPPFPSLLVLLRGLLLIGILLFLPFGASLRSASAVGALAGALVFLPELPKPLGSAGAPGDATVVAIYIAWGTASVLV